MEEDEEFEGESVCSSCSACDAENEEKDSASSADTTICIDAGRPVTLLVNSLAGELCRVSVTQGCSVHEIKLAVNAAVGIKPAEQQLVFGEKEPVDNKRIRVRDMQNVVLVRRSSEEAKWMSYILGGCNCRTRYGCPVRSFFNLAPETIRENRSMQLALLTYRDRHYCLALPFNKVFHETMGKIAAETKDRELALAFVSFTENSLSWLLDRFKKDPRVVLTAFRHFRSAIKFASRELLEDPRFFAKLVEVHGSALQFAPPAIKANRKVVSIAVQQDWRALEYADTSCSMDRTIVLTAVRKDWQALQFAHRALKADHEVVAAALEQSWQALKYADETTCRRDRSLVLQALRQSWRSYNFVVGELREDEEVLLAVVEQNWRALAPGSCSNLKVMLAAVQKDWRALSCASLELRENRELILAAASVDEDAWWYVGDDPEFDSEKWPQLEEDTHSCFEKSGNILQEAIRNGWLS